MQFFLINATNSKRGKSSAGRSVAGEECLDHSPLEHTAEDHRQYSIDLYKVHQHTHSVKVNVILQVGHSACRRKYGLSTAQVPWIHQQILSVLVVFPLHSGMMMPTPLQQKQQPPSHMIDVLAKTFEMDFAALQVWEYQLLATERGKHVCPSAGCVALIVSCEESTCTVWVSVQSDCVMLSFFNLPSLPS